MQMGVYMDGVMGCMFLTLVFFFFRLTVESTLSEWRNSIGKSHYIYFYVGFHLDVGGKSQKSKITLQLWFDK